jgi:hypothetical protein
MPTWLKVAVVLTWVALLWVSCGTNFADPWAIMPVGVAVPY